MRDPKFVFCFLFAIPAVQLFTWLVARHASDTKWYAATVLALLLTFAARLLWATGFNGMNSLAIYLGSALSVWICSEIFYELDLKHKIAFAAVCPFIGFASYIGAIFFVGKFLPASS